ncbi:MAG: hypothetical protein LBL80_00815 [Ruminococcus sp.]|jgi:hypothetical protein|nr:hypothetical protein [Ruminococcus sp.]
MKSPVFDEEIILSEEEIENISGGGTDSDDNCENLGYCQKDNHKLSGKDECLACDYIKKRDDGNYKCQYPVRQR